MKTFSRFTTSIVLALTLLLGLQPASYAQPLTTTFVYMPIVEMAPSASSCRPVAFGIIGLASTGSHAVLNAGVIEGVGPGSLISTLDAARASGALVMLALAGPRNGYQNHDGSFSITLWDQQMDPFRGLDVSSYVADGTLLGDGLIDEPQDPSNWGGHTVLPADIDAAAAYTKGIFPTMPTFVGSWATWLQSTGYHWQHLNGVYTPYKVKRDVIFGNVANWTISQTVAAQAQGLAVYMNMNVMVGGATGGEMTAAELLSNGTVLINATASRGTFMWDWASDPGYYSRPDIAPVLAQLSALAALRQACQ